MDEKGLTTLLHLVFQNNKKTGDVEGIARFLIQNGANVNSKDEKGRNALQILFGIPFAKIFLYAMTQLLIENGIDVNCIRTTTDGMLFLFCVEITKTKM